MQPRTLGIRELNTSIPSTAIPMTASDEIVSTSDVNYCGIEGKATCCVSISEQKKKFSTSERLLTLSTESDWSAANSEGLSAAAPLSVKPLVSKCGLRGVPLGVALGLPWAKLMSGACICSIEWRCSLLCSRRAPPSVAHLRMVCMSWFCFSGFDR